MDNLTLRNVQTRTAAFHHHEAELVEMAESSRSVNEVTSFDEPAMVTYQCPQCDTRVTVGVVTSESELVMSPEPETPVIH